MSNSFAQYYLSELAQLEDECADFARSFPQIAGNLGVGNEGTTDPHVRQLIESVAFIAARLKRQIDSAPRELAYGMLRSLAPQLTTPLPAMSVARFTPKSLNLEPAASVAPPHLRLHADGPDGECTFSASAQDTALWPLQSEAFDLADARSERHRVRGAERSKGVALRIEHPAKDLASNAPGALTFFISGPLHRAMAAVEALMRGVREVRMVALDGRWSLSLSRDSVRVLGFEPAHQMVPGPDAALRTTSLVSEFANFPRRFCFFQVNGLHCPSPSKGFFLVFEMEEPWNTAVQDVRHQILLNCLPIANVHARAPVAVLLKGDRDDYAIPRGADLRGPWDVFDVRRVRVVGKDLETEVEEYDGGLGGAGDDLPKWQGVRKEHAQGALGHASLMLRFANLAGPAGQRADMALLDLLCTNCEAPERLLTGQPLDIRGWECGYAASLEFVPTAYVPALLPSDPVVAQHLETLQWHAVGDDTLTHRVRQYLSVFQRRTTPRGRGLIQAIERIDREVVALPWASAPKGTAMGMGCRYVVTLDERANSMGGGYLLARVIRAILVQTHDLSLPVEVQVRGMDGRLMNVP